MCVSQVIGYALLSIEGAAPSQIEAQPMLWELISS
jgi:hypothetical protein